MSIANVEYERHKSLLVLMGCGKASCGWDKQFAVKQVAKQFETELLKLLQSHQKRSATVPQTALFTVVSVVSAVAGHTAHLIRKCEITFCDEPRVYAQDDPEAIN